MRSRMLFCIFLYISLQINARPILRDGVHTADSLLAATQKEISEVKPTKGIELATESLLISERIGYSKGKAQSYYHIGQLLSYFGDYKKSIEYLSLAEKETYTKKDPSLQANICRMKGQVYFQLKLEDASIREFHKSHSYAQKIEERSKKESNIGLAYENLGIAYRYIRDIPDSAFFWICKNDSLLSTLDDSLAYRSKINHFAQMGEYYTDHERYDSAAVCFEKANALVNQYNYRYYSWLFQRWGDMYRKTGNSDSAMVLYQKGLQNLLDTKMKNDLPGFYERLAVGYEERGLEDSVRWYRREQALISAELNRAKEDTNEDVFNMLLIEEKERSKTKHRKTLMFSLVILCLALLVTYELNREAIHFKKKNEEKIETLQNKLSDGIEEIVALAKMNDSALLPRFKSVYPEYTKRFHEVHPDLTNTELRLVVMIFLNFESKEIAEYTFITHRSVQTNKSRLRKKMGLQPDVDLYRYIKSFH